MSDKTNTPGMTANGWAKSISQALAANPAPSAAVIASPTTESVEDAKARWVAEHPGETLEGKRVVILRYGPPLEDHAAEAFP